MFRIFDQSHLVLDLTRTSMKLKLETVTALPFRQPWVVRNCTSSRKQFQIIRERLTLMNCGSNKEGVDIIRRYHCYD